MKTKALLSLLLVSLAAAGQKPLTGTRVNFGHPLGDAALIWTFSEGHGGVVTDSCQRYDGTPSTTTSNVMEDGSVLVFDNGADTVTSLLTPGPDCTVVMWINATSIANSERFWTISSISSNRRRSALIICATRPSIPSNSARAATLQATASTGL